MKKSELRTLIREMIEEELSTLEEKQSEAAKKAKQMGLTSLGFGRWGKDGEVKYITGKNGQLEKYSKAGVERKTGMKFGRGKNADNMYRPHTNIPAAHMKEPGVLKKHPDSWKATPDQHRKANKPHDALDSEEGTARHKIVSKIEDIAGTKLKVNVGDKDVVIPYDEFKKQTGLTDKQLSVYDKYASQWERGFDPDPGNNKVTIYGNDHFWEM